MLLSASYMGSIEQFALIAASGKAEIEFFDHYSRQTCRNRTHILTSDGPDTLVIPVVKPGCKTTGKDILIADSEWQPVHWRTIKSSYDSSPFLEFYEDDLAPFFHKPYKFLYDFDFELCCCMARLMGIKTEIVPTEAYRFDAEDDYRNLILKKARLENFHCPPYYHVFSGYGFPDAGLSALDLLCNMGPESILLLKDCLK